MSRSAWYITAPAIMLLSCAVFTSAPPVSIVPLSGSYSYTHSIHMYNGETFGRVDVENSLRIECDDVRAVCGLRLDLLFTNGHMCGLAAENVPVREGALIYTETTHDGKVCELTLTAYEKTIDITDRNYNCQPHLCGMRGYLDGISFPRDSREAL